MTLGAAFLESLQQKMPKLKEDHQDLVLRVYTFKECDRTLEGDRFIPPDPNLEYTAKLQSLDAWSEMPQCD